MKLIITLEDGQKTEGAVRSFSELPLKRDEKQFASIVMTYNVFLPITHPMFKKLYVPDQPILDVINERNVLAFVIEVTRGFTLSQAKFNDLNSYEEIAIRDTLTSGAYVWGTFAYVTKDLEVVKCDETVLMRKINELIKDYESDAWRAEAKQEPFAYAVPHITKMTFIKE
jgi:hypothetical protein